MHRTFLALAVLLLVGTAQAQSPGTRPATLVAAATPAATAPTPLNPFTGQPADAEQLARAEKLSAAAPADPKTSTTVAMPAPAPSAPSATAVRTGAAPGPAIVAAVKSVKPAEPAASCNCEADKDVKTAQKRTNRQASATTVRAGSVRAAGRKSAAREGEVEVDGLMPVPLLLSVVHNGDARTVILQLRADGHAQSYSDGDMTPWGRLSVLDSYAVDIEGRTFCVPGFETTAGTLPASSVPVIRVGR